MATTIEKARALGRVAYDGCTCSPDGNWRDCCDRHDEAYHLGHITRAQADAALRACMKSKGYIFLPWLYWGAVRLFGRRFYQGAAA